MQEGLSKKWHLDQHMQNVHSTNGSHPRKSNNYIDCDENDSFLPTMIDLSDYVQWAKGSPFQKMFQREGVIIHFIKVHKNVNISFLLILINVCFMSLTQISSFQLCSSRGYTVKSKTVGPTLRKVVNFIYS